MTQLINSVNSNPIYAKIVKIDMNNNLILAHEHGEHHHKEGHHEEKEAKEGHHEEKVEAKEGHHEEKEAKEGHHEEKEAKEGHHEEKVEGEEEKEGEEEVAAFVPTTDFSAEYIIYFGAGLLSIALIAVFIIWAQRYSDSNE